MKMKFIAYEELVIALIATSITGGLLWIVLQKFVSAFCIVLFAATACLFNRRYMDKARHKPVRMSKKAASRPSSSQAAAIGAFIAGIVLSYLLAFI